MSAPNLLPTPERSLCALMLNPSLDEKSSTSYAVLDSVSRLKGWDSVEIVNLFTVPTRNSKVLAATALRRAHILDARPRIDEALARNAEVLFAWGVAPLQGSAERLRREQINWVLSRAVDHGHADAWVMGGDARHPSRWRQYVGPQRALVTGGSTAERLDSALVRRSIRKTMHAMSAAPTRIGRDHS